MIRLQRKYVLPALLAVAMTAGVCLTYAPPPIVATWIWDAKLATSDSERMLSFAERHNVRLIYLQIDPQIDPNQYRVFIEKADLSGIEVHALDGDPSWASESGLRHIDQLAEWVRSFNEAAPADQRFSGIHVDIEPYNLPAWETEQRQELIDGWLAAMDRFVRLAEGLEGVETGADLPFWLEQIPLSPEQDAPSVLEWMIGKLDHVTIMAYRDRAAGSGGIVDAVKDEIRIADKLNKKVIVAVETNAVSPVYTTFHDKGAGYMHHQLLQVHRLLHSHASYYGIAVHDYAAWSRLEEAGRPSASGGR